MYVKSITYFDVALCCSGAVCNDLVSSGYLFLTCS